MTAGFQSWQFDRVSDFLNRVTASASAVASVTSRFPLASDDARPDVGLRKATYDVIDLQLALLEARKSLGDTPLEPLIATSLGLAELSARRLLALARSISLEDATSRRENRPWTWSAATAAFNALVHETMAQSARCEWSVLIEGVYLHDLDDEIHQLVQLALGFVMAPPQPEHVGEVIRRGSAHEEHVRGRRRWCAICGWLDAITTPTEVQKLYHLGFTRLPAAGPNN